MRQRIHSSCKAITSFAVIMTGIIVLLPSSLFAGVPLPDLVLFGKIYTSGGTQLSGVLPPGTTIAAFADGLEAPGENGGLSSPTVLAQTERLLDGGAGVAEYYVLRIKRFDGTRFDHQQTDKFLLSGDTVHIYIDWNRNGAYESTEEAGETKMNALLVGDALSDVRLLNLNDPNSERDADGDGLPDAWELERLGGTGQGASDDGNGDGVSNMLAFALGLHPNDNNASKLPFLGTEEDGSLVFFFRQAVSPTGLNYTLQASDTMLEGSWQTVTDASVEAVSIEGESKILKATIPGGVDRAKRTFRLFIHP